jgi:hypothetical protein
MILSKNVAQFKDTLFDGYSVFANKAINFVLHNSKRISTLSLTFKMVTVFAFLAFLPVGIHPTQTKIYETKVTFNKNSAFAVTPANTKIKIELGESEFDRVQREKNQANAPKTTTVARSYNDPSDFRAIYMAAGARFGIPWQLIEAVHEVESGKSGSTSTRSYAGAQGPMQFMPGTWRAYGIDGDGDGTADANNVVDAIYGGANLLASSGAAEGDFNAALFNYNHAQWYVNKVITIAYEIGLPR